MYAVICIEDGKYVRATSKSFTIEEARTYKGTIDESREPLIVPEDVLERAIVVNNKRISD